MFDGLTPGEREELEKILKYALRCPICNDKMHMISDNGAAIKSLCINGHMISVNQAWLNN